MCGPDVRWCVNEAGHTRQSEWSVVPKRTRNSEIISEKSQHEDSEEFRLRRIDARDHDLGSRNALADEPDLIWYPAEVNTSIRPGWFYHKSEDDKVKSVSELADIYIRSVGGNCTFLLNIPPTTDGLLHENDVRTLAELGNFLEEAFTENLVPKAEVSCDNEKACCGVGNIIEDSYEKWYMPERSATEIIINFGLNEKLGYIVIKENISMSQRIEKFSVDVSESGSFREVYSGTTIGYKRIVPLDCVETDCVRIRITDSRTEPTVSFIGIYRSAGT